MPRSIPKRFGEDIQQEVVRRYVAGERRVDIAKSLGTKSETITTILKAHNVEIRRDASYVRRFSPAIEQQIAERYRQGDSLNAIAKSSGLTIGGVRKIVKRHGVPMRHQGAIWRGLSAQQNARVVQLWQEGEAYSAIGLHLGVSAEVIKKVLRANGYEPTPRHRRRERTSNWKGGRTKTSGGYWYVYLEPDDPMHEMAGYSNYVLEHRLIMARKLGRPLFSSETVHHLDGNKENNVEENLQLRKNRHGRGQSFVCADCGSHNIVADGI